jgi:hypothetical protein
MIFYVFILTMGSVRKKSVQNFIKLSYEVLLSYKAPTEVKIFILYLLLHCYVIAFIYTTLGGSEFLSHKITKSHTHVHSDFLAPYTNGSPCLGGRQGSDNSSLDKKCRGSHINSFLSAVGMSNVTLILQAASVPREIHFNVKFNYYDVQSCVLFLTKHLTPATID